MKEDISIHVTKSKIKKEAYSGQRNLTGRPTAHTLHVFDPSYHTVPQESLGAALETTEQGKV